MLTQEQFLELFKAEWKKKVENQEAGHFSEALGITPATLRMIYNGSTRCPTLLIRAKLEQYFQVEVRWNIRKNPYRVRDHTGKTRGTFRVLRRLETERGFTKYVVQHTCGAVSVKEYRKLSNYKYCKHCKECRHGKEVLRGLEYNGPSYFGGSGGGGYAEEHCR